MACHALGNDEAIKFRVWMWGEFMRGAIIVIPEIADYEVRRSLLSIRATGSLGGLDRLHQDPGVYLPITTASIRRAADLWAQARRQGQATAGEKSIDGDVILAAQALEYCSDADDWWVATENRRHLSRYLGERAQPWWQIARPLGAEGRGPGEK